MSSDASGRLPSNGAGLTASSLTVFAGFTFFLATVFLLFSTDFVSRSVLGAFAGYQLLGCIMFLGSVAFWLCSKPVTANRGVILLVLSCLGFAGLVFAIVTGSWAYCWISCIAIGLGMCASTLMWVCALHHQHEKIMPCFVSAAAVAASLLSLLSQYLEQDALLVFLGTCYFLHVCCSVFLKVFKPEVFILPLIGNKDSDQRSKIGRGSDIMLAITNFEFGFIASLAFGNSIRLSVCFLAAAITGAILFLDYSRWHIVDERRIAPLTVPFTVMSFAGICLFGEIGTMVCLGLMSVLCTVYYLSGLIALDEHIRISNLSLMRVYSRARIFDYLGIVFGMLVGSAVSLLMVGSPDAAIRVSVITAFAYGFLAAFCHKARFPERDMEIDKVVDKGKKSPWRRRCQTAGDRFGLTDRQQEILLLVAQGRNAKYIETTLTISESTAQTHIRNIYRKTGVHSRQELLNLIEQTKLYGEE